MKKMAVPEEFHCLLNPCHKQKYPGDLIGG